MPRCTVGRKSGQPRLVRTDIISRVFVEGFRMRAKVFVVMAALALAVGGRLASAHHSFSAEFDATKSFKMTGTVTKVEWQNPHTYFFIDVTDDKGKTTNWGME